MEESLFQNGKKYISSKLASSRTGYATDYIGQLCRAKKVESTLVGRTWYVVEDSILEHKKNFQANSSRYISKNKIKGILSKNLSKSLNKNNATYNVLNNAGAEAEVENKVEASDNGNHSSANRDENKIHNLSHVFNHLGIKVEEGLNGNDKKRGVLRYYGEKSKILFPKITKYVKSEVESMKYEVWEDKLGKSKFHKNLLAGSMAGAALLAIVLLSGAANKELKDIQKSKALMALSDPRIEMPLLGYQSAASFLSGTFEHMGSQTAGLWQRSTSYVSDKFINWISSKIVVDINEDDTSVSKTPVVETPAVAENKNNKKETSIQAQYFISTVADKSYIPYLDQKISDLKNYFDTNLSAGLIEKVDRSFLSRQNDAITGSRGGISLSDLSSSGPISYDSGSGAFSFSFGGNNTWTGLSQFSRASSTMLSAYSAYFGGTATSSFSNAGILTLVGQAGCLEATAGVVSSTGSACGSGSSNFAFPFTITTNFGETVSATGTSLWVQNDIFASSSIRTSTDLFANTGTFSYLTATGTTASSFAGSVGIGTAVPGAKLEVVGDIISKGTSWTARSAAEANSWFSVTYGNGLFVAVAFDGTNRVQTSPDGITWTARSAAEANSWNSVTYGNGLFVAVAGTGTNRVMTSPDGITWTARSVGANGWTSVTYGNGLFVAVASSGTNLVQTSPDGITWTSRAAVEANVWRGVTYGNGRFVAVSSSGTNRVQTSGQPEINALAHNNIYQGGMSIFGNVGIGTTTPWAKLSVNPNALGSGVPEFVVGSSSATHFIVDGGGNVGIGETAPGSKLSVSGGGSFGAGYDTTAAPTNGLIIEGNVGIGTNNPANGSGAFGPGLHVLLTGTPISVGAGYAAIFQRSGAAGSGSFITTVSGSNGTAANYLGDSADGDIGGIEYDNALNALSFRTNNVSDRLLIDSSGNVGIGTATPTSARLVVQGSGTDSTAAGLNVTDSSGSSKLYVRNDGNVGIGNPAPDGKLTIQGAVSGGVGGNGHLQLRETNASNETGIFFVNTGNVTPFSDLAFISAKVTSGNALGSLLFYTRGTDGSGLQSERMRIDHAGNVGIGTTTPQWQTQLAGTAPSLAITDTSASANQKHWLFTSKSGELLIGTSTDLYATSSQSALTVSGTGFGTTTLLGLNIIGSATSTSNVGYNITNGCYAVNGSCLSSGSGASTTLLADSNTFTGTNNFTGKLGLASSSPWAKLSVNSEAGEPAFVVGSSTATSFIVDKSGNVGIGTTSPISTLAVVGTASESTTPIFTVSTSTSGQLLTVLANGSVGIGTTPPASATRSVLTIGQSPAAGSASGNYFTINAHSGFAGHPFLIENNGAFNHLLDRFGTAWHSGGFVSGGVTGPRNVQIQSNVQVAANRFVSWSQTAAAAQDVQDTGIGRSAAGILEINSATAGVLAKLNVSDIRVGTSTSAYNLTVASTTGSQLALSAGAGISQWAFRNAGGNLYFATTTVAGTATTSTSALTIIGSSGNVGIGTANPQSVLQVRTSNSSYLSIDALASQQAALEFSKDGSTKKWVNFVDVDSNDLKWWDSTGLAYRMTLQASTGNVGIGTTTPQWKTQLAGTAPSLAITDTSASANQKHWLFTSKSGELLIGTSTDLYATSTTAALTIDSNGRVGIATSSPWRTFSVNGTIGFGGVTSSVGAGSLCLSSTNEVVYNAASDACLSSTRATKHDITTLDLNGLDTLNALQPVSFIYNEGDGRTRYGFIAEDTALIDDHLATHDGKGVISGIDDRAIISVVVKALQELNQKVDAILAQIGNALNWFNEGKFFVRGDVCVDDVCITKDQFKEMILRSGVGAVQTVVGNPVPINNSNNNSNSNAPASSTPSIIENTATTTPNQSSPSSDDSGQAPSVATSTSEVTPDTAASTAEITPPAPESETPSPSQPVRTDHPGGGEGVGDEVVPELAPEPEVVEPQSESESEPGVEVVPEVI